MNLQYQHRYLYLLLACLLLVYDFFYDIKPHLQTMARTQQRLVLLHTKLRKTKVVNQPQPKIRIKAVDLIALPLKLTREINLIAHHQRVSLREMTFLPREHQQKMVRMRLIAHGDTRHQLAFLQAILHLTYLCQIEKLSFDVSKHQSLLIIKIYPVTRLTALPSFFPSLAQAENFCDVKRKRQLSLLQDLSVFDARYLGFIEYHAAKKAIIQFPDQQIFTLDDHHEIGKEKARILKMKRDFLQVQLSNKQQLKITRGSG